MIRHSWRTENPNGQKRWLPCRAWDFDSLMYPSVCCSKLFGFFPYKYENEKYEISKTRLAFAAFLACVYLSMQIYVLYAVNFSDPNDAIAETMAENFFALLDGSIPIMMILTSYSRLVTLQKVSKVSRMLSPRDFNDMAKFLHLMYIMHFLFNLLYIPLNFVNKHDVPFTRRNVNLILVFTSCEAVLFYVNCVYVLGACFEKLNTNLQRLREPSTSRQSEFIEEQRRQAVVLLRKVKHCENVHEEISDACEFLNQSSCSIHINFTAAAFVLVAFDAYSTMIQIFNTGALSTNLYLQYEYFSFVFLRLSRFALLVWVCETMTGHATDINTTVHDLANNCTDDTVKRELRYFALQVLHRDNGITTKAFKMNGKLLSQVLSGILMYIMIFFQFLISSNCAN